MRRLASLIVVAACGGGGQSPPDVGDFPLPDTNNPDSALCDGAFAQFVLGELIDWDSSGSSFQGIVDARITFPEDPGFAYSTPPNGRLEFCLQLATASDAIVLDVDASGGYLDGAMYLEREAFATSTAVSMRAFTQTRAASFFTESGLTFDANAAQLVVQLTGDRSDLALDRTHATAQAGSDDGAGTVTWSPGTTGRYVLFPNIAVAEPTTANLSGDPGGSHAIPLAPGQLTLAVIAFFFL